VSDQPVDAELSVSSQTMPLTLLFLMTMPDARGRTLQFNVWPSMTWFAVCSTQSPLLFTVPVYGVRVTPVAVFVAVAVVRTVTVVRGIGHDRVVPSDVHATVVVVVAATATPEAARTSAATASPTSSLRSGISWDR
jgi:hypothetical protein